MSNNYSHDVFIYNFYETTGEGLHFDGVHKTRSTMKATFKSQLTYRNIPKMKDELQRQLQLIKRNINLKLGWKLSIETLLF